MFDIYLHKTTFFVLNFALLQDLIQKNYHLNIDVSKALNLSTVNTVVLKDILGIIDSNILQYLATQPELTSDYCTCVLLLNVLVHDELLPTGNYLIQSIFEIY